jgi:peptidoglycan-N-acetylglucosamine deacetylase
MQSNQGEVITPIKLLSGQLNLLTFDIEEWYLSYESSQITTEKWSTLESRVEPSVRTILTFLEANSVKATFFVMGYTADRHPGLIKEIADGGHDIGYHSYRHQLPATQGPKAFAKDLSDGLNLLRDITGKTITLYRAPRFSLCQKTVWMLPILAGHGITTSSSTRAGTPFGNTRMPALPFRFQFKNLEILEYPLITANPFGIKLPYSGSGFFRLLPAHVIRHYYKKNIYNNAYFHPRDFDINLPTTPLLPFYRNIMNRLGNSTTLPKLTQILKNHTFMSISQANKYLIPDAQHF